MSTPAVKRRRLNTASSILSKPFRSPLKIEYTNPEPKTKQPSKLHQSTHLEIRENVSIESSTLLDLPKLSSAATTTMHSKQLKSTFSPNSTATFSADPNIAPLMKRQRDLENQLRDLKEKFDTAQQARKIESDSKKKDPDGEIDGELKALRQRWKEASRAAAEELFTGVRDRVNRMGGPKAWKEMQQRQQDFLQHLNEEPQHRPDPDTDGEDAHDREEIDLYADYNVEPETANEREARGSNGVLEEDLDQEFTLSMMLRTLNIKLDIIGYDWEEQRWVD